MADPFLGEIRMVGFNFAPNGWFLCNGQQLPISQYQALFALLGTTYGGNGTSNFNLPDLQGRVPLNVGSGAGLPTYAWGQKAGSPTVTLQTANLAPHNHLMNANTSNGGAVSPGGSILAVTTDGQGGKTPTQYPAYIQAAGNTTLAPTAITQTGNATPFSIEPPYLAIYFIIAWQGIFPSRP